MEKYHIRIHLAGEGVWKVQNVTSGVWYRLLPGKSSAVVQCDEGRAGTFTTSEVEEAFKGNELYQVERTRMSVHRMGNRQLHRVENPATGKWYGRTDPNGPYQWVDSRHDATSLNETIIKRTFPANWFDLKWLSF